MESYYWLVFMAALILFEIISLGLTTIWFAIGALAAFVTALLGGNLIVQIIVFVVVSVVSLIFTRPIAVKFFNQDRIKTNADSLVGQKAKVLETIDNLNAMGYVSVNGVEWMARTEDNNDCIEKGSTVVIDAISGAKLIVSLLEETGEKGENDD
ncbi:MAG: NfeD family protein [Lachnospiraceae bacterium]|nr:NfeD family protein [Lachnospiraceae bacterium]